MSPPNIDAMPSTKAARQQRIIDILKNQDVASQSELSALLADGGHQVTQATLSRDLVELNAMKVRAQSGALVYVVPAEGGDSRPRVASETPASEAKFVRLAEELMVSAEASGNLVVIRTPPGAANFLASSLDRVAFADVLGTIAGDDTVMVISRSANGGSKLCQRLLALANRDVEPPTLHT